MSGGKVSHRTAGKLSRKRVPEMLEEEETGLSVKREGWMSLWKNRQKKWSRRGAFSATQKALQKEEKYFVSFIAVYFSRAEAVVKVVEVVEKVQQVAFDAKLGLLSMCFSSISLPCVHIGFPWILFISKFPKYAARFTGYNNLITDVFISRDLKTLVYVALDKGIY